MHDWHNQNTIIENSSLLPIRSSVLSFINQKLGWRWLTASLLFMFAFYGLMMGVGLSERPNLQSVDYMTKAYYSMGLFVMGGLDLGTPEGGPLLGRIMLWISYFGAPILAASTVIEAIIRTISPYRWRFQRFNDHVIVSGSGELTISYLKEFRNRSPRSPLIIIDSEFDSLREEEFKQKYKATVITGDITRSYFLSKLGLNQAKKVMLLGNDNFQNYEAAHKILTLAPSLKNEIVIHCNSIRFMRAMAGTHVAQQCRQFNAYQLAASALVKTQMMSHFIETESKDVVVIAGFGNFGQTILEELELNANEEIETMAIIGLNIKRRMQIVDEQNTLGASSNRKIFEGNISHPEVWKKLRDEVDLVNSKPTIILCTRSAEDNFRTSLWLKRKYPGAVIIARSHLPSKFAADVSEQYGILNVSVNKLVRDNFPVTWFKVD